MVNLTIYKHYFTNTDCYKAAAIQEPKGIQVHSTGANNPYLKRYVQPDDGRLGKNTNKNDHNRAGLNVCASAYIGKLNDGTPAIYQTLPWNYRCWLSGSGPNGNANKKGYIGYEICEDGLNNKQYFEQVVLGLSVLLDAYLCKEFNISVDNIHDHAELCKMGLASNHRDIQHWLSKFGYTMDDYRNKVRNAIAEGVKVTYIEGDGETMEPIYFAKVTATSGNTVNMRSTPSSANDKNIIARIKIGETVDVLAETDATWAQISYKGNTGYMMRKFLQKIEPEIPTPVNPSAGNETITVDKAKLEELKQMLEAALNVINSILG